MGLPLVKLRCAEHANVFAALGCTRSCPWSNGPRVVWVFTVGDTPSRDERPPLPTSRLILRSKGANNGLFSH